MALIQRRHQRSTWGLILAVVLGLVVGTAAGNGITAIANTWLGHPLVLTPWSLDLYIVGIRLWVQTNVAGIVLAFIGVVIYEAV